MEIPHELMGRVWEQLAEAPTIGVRKTPVISVWPMRPKWEKWGQAWEMAGWDGDIRAFSPQECIVPHRMRLTYFRTGNKVVQTAFVDCPERRMDGTAAVKTHNAESMAGFPRSI